MSSKELISYSYYLFFSFFHQPLPTGTSYNRKRKFDEEATPPPYVWGSVDIQQFVKLLTESGIADVKLEEGPSGGHIVHLVSDDRFHREYILPLISLVMS